MASAHDVKIFKSLKQNNENQSTSKKQQKVRWLLQRKSTGAKAAHKMMMKLTHRVIIQIYLRFLDDSPIIWMFKFWREDVPNGKVHCKDH